MDQFTVAAEPFIVAENCNVEEALPEESVQPVQLVSMEAVPGEMVSAPLPEPPVLDPPPQPAIATAAEMAKNHEARRQRDRAARAEGFLQGPGCTVESCETCFKDMVPAAGGKLGGYLSNHAMREKAFRVVSFARLGNGRCDVPAHTLRPARSRKCRVFASSRFTVRSQFTVRSRQPVAGCCEFILRSSRYVVHSLLPVAGGG